MYSDTERFYSKASIGTGCWIWTAALDKGYGRFQYDGVLGYAHRFSYEHFFGAIPADLTIDHLCRNRACVNPSHLEPVPNGVNVLRGDGPAAQNAKKNFCGNGHEFTQENTQQVRYRDLAGAFHPARQCRKCQRAAAYQYRLRCKEKP